jgi:hypothetical protein
MTPRSGRPPVRAPLAAALALVVVLGACKSGDGTPAADRGVGPVTAGSTAQFASCGDWRRGTPAQRYATIRDIRGHLTPQTSTSETSDLSDDAAYAVFENSCSTAGTEQLRLYKLYARAQAFAPYRDDAKD